MILKIFSFSFIFLLFKKNTICNKVKYIVLLKCYKFCNKNIKPFLLWLGFDVIDEYARIDPDKKALIWCDDNQEIIFTFNDMKKLSNQAANFFKSQICFRR